MRQIRNSKFEIRSAVILPVVLFILVLIGLLAAMFSFRVHADLSATQAVAYRLQTRLAAEAGVEYVRMILRDSRFDRSVWYHNPELFNRIILTAHNRDAQTAGTNQEFEETFVYRFSIVADDPTDDKDYIRFGISDEAGKINLNTATEDQLLKLVTIALGEDTETDPQLIVDAILDWRDTDIQPRGEVGDTESLYYRALDKPYRVKNGPFDTVEELLLVKGITPALLYGEDFDRNGLITENEKDADRSFPDDNQDDVLNRGLYPYLTVLSKENNVSNDNRPRVYLAGNEETVRAELALIFPDEPSVVDYIVQTAKAPPPQGGDGTGQPGGSGPGGARGPGGTPGQGDGQTPPAGQTPRGPGRRGQQGPGGRQQQQQAQPAPEAGTGAQPGGSGDGSKDQRRQQAKPPKPKDGKPPRNPPPGNQPPVPPMQPDAGAPPPGEPPPPPGDPSNPQSGPGDPPQPDDQQQGQEGEGQDNGEQEGDGQGDGGGGQEQDDNPPITSPASLMLPRTVNGQVTQSPLTVDHLAVLMDKTTMVNPAERTVAGRINVNTAPPQVLECIDGLTAEHIQAIVATRENLDPGTLSTPAWLVTEGIMDVTAFEKIAPHVTARGQQFTIEAVGFADHVGMVTRLQVVVEMNGPVAQTIYYRDISNLGGSFPIREEDKEKIRAR